MKGWRINEKARLYDRICILFQRDFVLKNEKSIAKKIKVLMIKNGWKEKNLHVFLSKKDMKFTCIKNL